MKTPELPLEPREAQPVWYCTCCGDPIYEGDTYYDLSEWNLEAICESCMACLRKVAEKEVSA